MQDNNHVVPYQEAPEKQNSPKAWQKVLIILGIFVLFIAAMAISYFLGTKQKDNINQISPSPTQALIQMPTLPPTPISTQSATPTRKLSITTTPSPTPMSKSQILESIGSLSGFRSSNHTGNNTLDIRAGRNQNLVTRGFVTFDLSDLPNSANIESATIRLYQAEVIGDPYNVAGALKLDHLTYGNSLDSADYSVSALISNLATISNNSAIEWKEADVTDELKNDVANARSYSQFRIHFTQETTGGDAIGDFVYFDSANSYDSNTNHLPQLVVKYD